MTEAAPIRNELQVVPLRTGGPVAGIIPQSIDEVVRLAQGIAKSGLAPNTMNTPEKITVAILTGLEIGLPPMSFSASFAKAS